MTHFKKSAFYNVVIIPKILVKKAINTFFRNKPHLLEIMDH